MPRHSYTRASTSLSIGVALLAVCLWALCTDGLPLPHHEDRTLDKPLPPSPSTSAVPEQVHITQGKHPGSLVVSWATNATAVSVVRYGTKSGVYTSKVVGTASTYTRGAYTSPFLHNAKIKGLQPSTTYYYAIGDDTPGLNVRELSFTTLPPVSANECLTFTVIGDLGQTEFSESTVMHVLQDPTQQFTIIAGDLSYADGDQLRWDRWGNLFEPLLSSRVFQPAVGNHEIEIKDFDRGSFEHVVKPAPPGGWQYVPFQAYQARFPHAGPEEDPASLGGISSSLWYSYSAGPAHFIHLSSYSEFSPGSPQHAWLVAELASIDHKATPWVFAVVHAPWYNSNMAHQQEPAEWNMRYSFEQLLCDGGVDVVFAGHVHAYERVGPAFNGTLRDGGITYINVGDGGNREGLATRYLDPQPDWSMRREASYGHGRVRIINGTSAVWSWHRIQDGEPVAADVVAIPHNSRDSCTPSGAV